jgi:hypothetical protein
VYFQLLRRYFSYAEFRKFGDGIAIRGTRLDHSTQLLLAVFAVVLLLLVALIGSWMRRGPGALPYYSRQTLLSKGEIVFYYTLIRSLPRGVVIAPKVRLADLVDCSPEARKAGFGARINQKHVDFVLIDAESTEFRLVIELDDQSHRQRRAIEADRFKDRTLAAAGIPILRVAAQASYSPADIRNAIGSRL